MEIITRKEALAKGLSRYFTGKPCPKGHLAQRTTNKSGCVVCLAAARQKWAEANSGYFQDWYQANRDHVIAKSKQWAAANPERAKELSRRKSARYFRANKESCYQARRDRLVRSPQFRMRVRLADRINKALRGLAKSASTAELVGCSLECLVSHLEAQFSPGMSWENYGHKGWHVDHIRPCASFDLTDPVQQKECFHFTNLQPLWATDNLAKSDRY